MPKNLRTIAIVTAASGAALGIGAVTTGPASAAVAKPTEPSIQRMINANYSDHDLDMTVTFADGTTDHKIVKTHEGFYPEGDYNGQDTITVKDSGGVAFFGRFTYNGDWVAGKMDTTPRLRYTWHTGPFGGFDFR